MTGENETKRWYCTLFGDNKQQTGPPLAYIDRETRLSAEKTMH